MPANGVSMKTLAWVGAFLVGVATLCVAILNIVDYALNKPQVVDAAVGPALSFYRTWMLEPLTIAVARLSTGPAANIQPEADSFSAVVSTVIIVLLALLWTALMPRLVARIMEGISQGFLEILRRFEA